MRFLLTLSLCLLLLTGCHSRQPTQEMRGFETATAAKAPPTVVPLEVIETPAAQTQTAFTPGIVSKPAQSQGPFSLNENNDEPTEYWILSAPQKASPGAPKGIAVPFASSHANIKHYGPFAAIKLNCKLQLSPSALLASSLPKPEPERQPIALNLPLNNEAILTGFHMQIDQRKIRAVLMPHAQAQHVFKQAQQANLKPKLIQLSQGDQDHYQLVLDGLSPMAKLDLTIDYLQLSQWDDRQDQFILPLPQTMATKQSATLWRHPSLTLTKPSFWQASGESDTFSLANTHTLQYCAVKPKPNALILYHTSNEQSQEAFQLVWQPDGKAKRYLQIEGAHLPMLAREESQSISVFYHYLPPLRFFSGKSSLGVQRITKDHTGGMHMVYSTVFGGNPPENEHLQLPSIQLPTDSQPYLAKLWAWLRIQATTDPIEQARLSLQYGVASPAASWICVDATGK